jgi:hypothetical protein
MAEAADILPFSAVGDSTGAFTDFDVTTCYISSTVRGVWYKLVGSGKVSRVQVLNAKFQFRIALFKGSCDDLFCDGYLSGDGIFGDGSASLDFTSLAGVEHLVLVTGYSRDSDVGTFNIDIMVRAGLFAEALRKLTNRCATLMRLNAILLVLALVYRSSSHPETTNAILLRRSVVPLVQ